MKLQNLLKSKNIFDFLTAFLIFYFCSCAFAPQGAKAQEASFYLLPESGNYKAGETFSVQLLINAQGVPINAAQSVIDFPTDILKVTNISKNNSIFNIWVQEPVFSNSKGEISFGGGLPNPGYIGKAGKIMTIFFQAKSEGKAKISSNKEIITANDPWGTNVFSFSREAVFAIFPPEKAPTKPKLIDTTPPEPFEITIDNEGDPANPQPLLYFETKDDLSGISHYEIKIGTGDTFKVFEGESNPFRLPLQSPGTHKIIIKAIDKAGNYTESTTEVKIESILPPQITVCPNDYVAGEEVLHIEGTGLSNQKTIIFFEADEKSIKTWEVLNNEKGEWSLSADDLFKSGFYRISAREKNEKGAISYQSNECKMKVIFSGISIGPWIISYNLLIWIFLIILISILLIIIYLLFRIWRSERRVKRETKDLKEKFYKEYNELELDIKSELEKLRRIIGEGGISREERKREEELLKNLADVKNVFDKELKDVEKK